MVQIFKSDETAKIVAVDAVMDAATTAITRGLYVYGIDEVEKNLTLIGCITRKDSRDSGECLLLHARMK